MISEERKKRLLTYSNTNYLRCTTASVRSVLYIANITNVVVYEAIATL